MLLVVPFLIVKSTPQMARCVIISTPGHFKVMKNDDSTTISSH